MEITAKDLRSQAKGVLESVERGEEVIITYRGRPRAKIVALEQESSSVPDRELFGIWKDREDLPDVEAYVDRLREARF